MSNTTQIIYNHPKLGQLIFEKNADGKADFSQDKILEIMKKGLNLLTTSGLLTQDDNSTFAEKIMQSKFVPGNQSSASTFSFSMNSLTGQIVDYHFKINPAFFVLGVEKTIDDLLGTICSFIVGFKHPREISEDYAKYGQDGGHSSSWRRYASELLSPHIIEYYTRWYEIYDELGPLVTTEQVEILQNMYDEDWMSTVVDSYLELLEDGEELTLKEHIENEIWRYEDDPESYE